MSADTRIELQDESTRGRPPVSAGTVAAYLTELAKHSHKGRAAEAAGLSRMTLVRLRRRDPQFAADEEDAMAGLADRVMDRMVERAIEAKDPDLPALLALFKKFHDPQRGAAVQVNVDTTGGAQTTVSPAAQAQLDAELRRRLLPAGDVIEGEVVATPDDGSDLI